MSVEAHLTKPKLAEYVAARMMGRCANGNEADSGRRYHAIRKDGLSFAAVCGATPGRRSAGWADHSDAVRAVEAVDCPRCRFAMSKFGLLRAVPQSMGGADHG